MSGKTSKRLSVWFRLALGGMAVAILAMVAGAGPDIADEMDDNNPGILEPVTSAIEGREVRIPNTDQSVDGREQTAIEGDVNFGAVLGASQSTFFGLRQLSLLQVHLGPKGVEVRIPFYRLVNLICGGQRFVVLFLDQVAVDRDHFHTRVSGVGAAEAINGRFVFCFLKMRGRHHIQQHDRLWFGCVRGGP